MISLKKKHLVGIMIGIFCLAVLWANAFGQISDLRYARVPPPGLSEGSRVEVRVNPEHSISSVKIASIAGIVKARLDQLGYPVVFPRTKEQSDLVLQVTCEEIASRQVPFSPVPDAESRVEDRIPPPPCKLAYSYKGGLIPGMKVDRIIYAEGVSTMDSLGADSAAMDTAQRIHRFLNQYDFPILLAAEWGHAHRLFHMLNNPETSVKQKALIVTLLGEIQEPEAFPVLVNKLEDAKLAGVAARALGCYALRGRPYLLNVLKSRADPLLQTAAATGLGKVAAATGDSQPTPFFLELVTDPTVDIRVKTALVWALGKAPDFRAYPTLAELEKSIWMDPSNDPQLQRLREAVNWSIREVKQGGHGDDF